MRGIQGLVVAGLLGLLGVALNYVYLFNKTKEVESVSFLGIKDGVVVEEGEKLKATDFAEVRVPRAHAGDLETYVYLYQDLETVRDITASRPYQGGDLVFRKDYRTPPPELKFLSDESIIWVMVTSQAFVPELIDPGDKVTFVFPPQVNLKQTPGPTTPGGEPGVAAPGVRLRDDEPEFVGPFEVKSLGGRLGSAESGRRSRSAQEGNIGIVVVKEGDKLERQAMRLLELKSQGNNRDIGLILNEKKK
ncbi:hypothetical protein [Lignipirellula cremea]|uniref:SAF domain-containing protein n=1 Tax=Lignipirellula cremea TaxID=2528010 RepID=A0A518E1Q4_9BACT|nr:hypothetical protein [Lignipirellula cremea]QDU98020.1 hypothetical protein Pla8534_58810 [Lignipirellula cremea]